MIDDTTRALIERMAAELHYYRNTQLPIPWASRRIAGDLATEARAFLAAEPQGEGPSETELYDLAEEYDGDPVPSMRAALARWGRPAAPPAEVEVLPPGYIDAEHTGEDRQLLETFYAACNSEGGTADEIYLRGLRAVLAHRSRPAAPPAEGEGLTDEELWKMYQGPGTFCPITFARAAIAADRARCGRPAAPPAPPVDGEVARLVARLRDWRTVLLLQERERIAALLQQQHHQPVPAHCLTDAAVLALIEPMNLIVMKAVVAALKHYADVKGAEQQMLSDARQVIMEWLHAYPLPLPTSGEGQS